MLDALRRPLRLPLLLVGVVASAFVVALYCLAYTSFAGRPETPQEALSWAIANICPWLLALEAAKRAARWTGVAAILLAAAAASILLGYALPISNDAIEFEIVRRLPALAIVAACTALLRSAVGRTATKPVDLPLLPRQIDGVHAAGNYVELRMGSRTVVHRASIGAAERELAAHGFIRIHRSILVRRDRIARVRPQDVVLVDGTHLKVGKRYRAALPA